MAVMSVGMYRRPQNAGARFQLVWKFRKQLNLGDAECAGGRTVRCAQCDHRPHEAPIGVVEFRGAAPQRRQRGQRVLERQHARSDRFPLSTRSRPRSASTDSSGFRHFKLFDPFATRSCLSLRDKGSCRTVVRGCDFALAALPATRFFALVASPCASVRSFVGGHDHNTITSNSAHFSTNVNFSSCGRLTALRHPGGIRKRGGKGDGGARPKV